MKTRAADRSSEDFACSKGRLRRTAIVSGLLLALLGYGATALAQTNALPTRLITQPIDENDLVTLGGNVRPEMTPANDRGAVADDLQLNHLYLQLNRSSEQDAAATALVDQLHNPASSVYHQWLTVDQIAAQFGPSTDDVSTLTSWLESHGFTIDNVYLANGVIDFSGSAGSVSAAFHTEIHNLSVNGQHHIANASDPRIPAALAPAVLGVVSLNDFRPAPQLKTRANHTVNTRPDYTVSSIYQLLVPGDLQTIYNIKPIYAYGVSGQGQTIVVLEDSDLYTTADWYTFRKTFGLAQKFPQGTLAQVHPQPSRFATFSGGGCADPGVNGDDSEAAVDTEWSSASAPGAAIVLASCADTETNFGGFIAMQNLLTTASGARPNIISISYGGPESEEGAAFNAYINQLYQLAVLQGVSVFVSAGDAGADSTDQFAAAATSGINMSAFATTPNNVAVGGTDFADAYFGTNASYWSATNAPDYSSALSYIPEIPWDDSCASQLISSYVGYPTPYGPSGFCNSALGEEFLIVAAGSGGPSSCAFGTPAIPGIVGGTCRGYPKPSYQSLVYGNPQDGARDIPDVSLFASNGIWGHYYLICYSDPTPGFGGAPCTGAPDTWAGFGGTSFGAPIMAGIQSLINQTTEPYQGNPDYTLYQLAASEYGSHGSEACNSTLGNQVASDCVFYDVTLGDDDVNCLPLVVDNVTVGTFDCYLDGAINGVLSTSNSHYRPAYVTGKGYDYPSGIGSVNAFNLLKAWPGSHLRE